jgi:hypothetical protein
MAIIALRTGRPYHTADIDFSKDPDLELYARFYEACSTLCYFDTVVLSRALGVDVVTVRRWKARQNFPERKGTAQHVINWVASGKPRKIVSQREGSTSQI